NCTIQELKHVSDKVANLYEDNFNCTIQELKRIDNIERYPFKLFQLHHTGIKTLYCFMSSGSSRNFNCTIQELKRNIATPITNVSAEFQLHHTGI
ncbi:hypothetical protein HMPREF1988_02034, partial [Porphyromonas gingivalis F0185]